MPMPGEGGVPAVSILVDLLNIICKVAAAMRPIAAITTAASRNGCWL